MSKKCCKKETICLSDKEKRLLANHGGNADSKIYVACEELELYITENIKLSSQDKYFDAMELLHNLARRIDEKRWKVANKFLGEDQFDF